MTLIDLKSKSIQCYRQPITNTSVTCEVSVEDLFLYITHFSSCKEITAMRIPNGIVPPDLVDLKTATETLRTITDKDEHRDYKSRVFPYVLFSGLFESRKDSGLKKHSNLICIDFDHLGDQLDRVRQKLIDDPSLETVLLFTSPSGDGLKWVVEIDVERASHRVWFQAISNYVRQTYGLEADESCINESRACYIPYDPNCYICTPQEECGNKKLFDIEAYFTDENTHQKMTENTQSQGSVQAYDDDAKDVVRQTVDEVCRRGLDITGGYKQWLSIGFGLAQLYGEEGRSMYHDLSRLSSKYSEADTDRQYDNCLRSGNGSCTYKSLLHYAEQAGVSPAAMVRVSHPVPLESVNSANVPMTHNIGKIGKLPVFDTFGKVCASGTLAQVSLSGVRESAQITFSDKLATEDLPSLLAQIFEVHDNISDRDKMILGMLDTVSGLMGYANGSPEERSGVFGIYDGRRIFSPIYTIIYGNAASNKGEIKYCKHLIGELRQEIIGHYKADMAEYEHKKAEWEARNPGKKRNPDDPAPKEPEYRDPLISGNSTSSEFYRLMDANQGSGIMIETEADTVATMINSEYGNYSDVWRRTFHHESISMNRVTDNLHIDIEEPRLSILITCTPGQLPSLFPASSWENGLGSRFLFYGLPDQEVEFHDVFARNKRPLEDVYKEMGHNLMPLYHALAGRKNHPIQFVLSQAQKQEFIDTYNAILHEQFDMLGAGISAFVFRIALVCFRYAMVLTSLRRLDDWGGSIEHGIFDDDEQALVCDDRDFKTAMTIVGSLIYHTARVYSILNKEQDNPFATEGIRLEPQQLAIFKKLPEGEFRTSEFIEIAMRHNIQKRSAQRMLSHFTNVLQIVLPVRHGYYQKRKTASTES